MIYQIDHVCLCLSVSVLVFATANRIFLPAFSVATRTLDCDVPHTGDMVALV